MIFSINSETSSDKIQYAFRFSNSLYPMSYLAVKIESIPFKVRKNPRVTLLAFALEVLVHAIKVKGWF